MFGSNYKILNLLTFKFGTKTWTKVKLQFIIFLFLVLTLFYKYTWTTELDLYFCKIKSLIPTNKLSFLVWKLTQKFWKPSCTLCLLPAMAKAVKFWKQKIFIYFFRYCIAKCSGRWISFEARPGHYISPSSIELSAFSFLVRGVPSWYK